MNKKKIYFDLQTVDSSIFTDKLVQFNFQVECSYNINIFIVPYDDNIKNYMLNRFSNRKNFGSFVWIKTIPFILLVSDNKTTKLKELFYNIFMSISYTDVGFYSGVEGTYNSAFCISIESPGISDLI